MNNLCGSFLFGPQSLYRSWFNNDTGTSWKHGREKEHFINAQNTKKPPNIYYLNEDNT